MRVGVIGVGAMGAHLARHMVDAGHKVWANDVDAKALAATADIGATPEPDLAKLAKLAEIFVIVVATDAQSRAATRALLEAGPAAGSIIAVAGTNHPQTMIELAEACGRQDVGFIDAPVCFGMQGAVTGTLATLCGGEAGDVEKALPVFESYSRFVSHIGGHGAGQLAKTCNNMLHWAACVANYEVLLLAKRYGIDAQKMRETLMQCPGNNVTLERWDATKFKWHEKDMDVALDLSQAGKVALPLFAQVDQLVKLLGPEKVQELLYGAEAEYLGSTVVPMAAGEGSLAG